ncbi:MAG: ORF6N domain-containing protein [Bacteroidales bacterium]|nr:ORF6N domain-containing protein [Bacteroidales bacterium]
MSDFKPNKNEFVDLVYTIRKKRVMLDQDLAKMFGVETRVLNQQVKRNIDKFPASYMFQLTAEEFKDLKYNMRSQSVISSWGGRRYAPYAFTDRGVLMLANVLPSKKAAKLSLHIVDTFVEIKNILAENQLLKTKIDKLEKEAAKKNKVIQTFYAILLELNKKT